MFDMSFTLQDRTFGNFELPERQIPLSSFGWSPRLVLKPACRMDARARLIKRFVDIAFALLALILLALPALIIMVAIAVESPGSVLFRQRRIGLDGQSFMLLKFRTMRQHAVSPGMLTQATRDDPRVTRVGCWLRRYSVDELPQLINVLLGEMSIVGPRPHAPGTRAGGRLFEDVSHRYAERHSVKPGLTGLAQVRGWRGETENEEKLLRRIDCDLEYIAWWSAKLDLEIIWRTAGSVLHMHNAY